MNPFLLSFFCLALLSAVPANQAIEPQNYGPPYFYPVNRADRLYKLPWTCNKPFNVGDGYRSEPGGSHHPDYSVDFNLPLGEPLCAARAGTVVGTYNHNTVCNTPGSVGNYVYVGHIDSMPDTTRPSGMRRVTVKDYYYHVDPVIPVTVGQRVEQGQVVAYANCTGQDGGGPHLHFRVYVDSIAGVWRHLGWFSAYPTHFFASIPTPFVEVVSHANGLVEQGDYLVSQNQLVAAETNAPGRSPFLLRTGTSPLSGDPFIVFSIGRVTLVRIGLYRADGSRIRNLYDGYGTAGLTRVVCPAGDLAAGVYMVRLRANGQHMAARIAVVR